MARNPFLSPSLAAAERIFPNTLPLCAREPDGSMHYDKREIWEPSYHAAMRGIMLVKRELEKNGAGNTQSAHNGDSTPTS